MAVQNANQKESKPYVFNVAVEGQDEPMAIFGIIANVVPNSQAESISLEEWNELLKSGKLSMAPYEKKERDHSDFRKALGL